MQRATTWTDWLTAHSPWGWAVRLAAFAALEGALALLSGFTALPPYESPLLWLNTGLLTGVLWQSRRRTWPLWIAAGSVGKALALLGSWSTMSPGVAALVGALEAAQCAAAAYLLQRFIAVRDQSLGFPETMRLVLVCAAATISFGVPGGWVLSRAFPDVPWSSAWLVWFLTDLMGGIMVLPVLVNWELPRHTGAVMPRRPLEAALYVAAAMIVSYLVFAEIGADPGQPLVRRYWLIPVFIWGALRLTPRCVMVGFLGCATVTALRAEHSIQAMRWSGLEALDQHVALQYMLLVGGFSTLALAAVMWERRSLQAALHAQLELLNWTLEAAQIGPWEWRADEHRTVFSDVWKRQLGYTAQEIPDTFHSFASRLHPEDQARVIEYAQRYVAAPPEAPFEQQFRIRHRNGNYRSILSRARLLRGPDGAVRKLSGIHIDITPLKEAEEALRYQAQFEELIAALSARFIRYDLAQIDQEIAHSLEAIGRFTQVDRCFFYVFSDDLRTVSCRSEWCDERLPLVVRAFQDMPTDQFRWTLDHLVRGDTVYLPRIDILPPDALAERRLVRLNHVRSIVLEPVLSARRLVGLIGFVSVREPRQWPASHLTLLKLVAEMLSNAVARQHSEASLADARGKLTQAARLSLLGEMVAGISHELKQPLHAMRGFAAAGLRATHSDLPLNLEELQLWLSRIVGLVDRSSAIIQRFRDFSRRAVEAYGDQPLAELLDEAQEIVRADLRKHGMEIRFSAPPGLTVHGDAVQLVQVFVNLLHNACEAARDLPAERRRVDIDAHRINGAVYVNVRDFGRGMPAHLAESIFEPFVTTRPDGTGIGLAICRTIVREHGGAIAAEPAEPGLVFRLTLPVEHLEAAS